MRRKNKGTKREDQEKRIEKVNQLVAVIAGCGRRFLSYGEKKMIFSLDEKGRVWLCDPFSGKRIYTHREGQWDGFSEGGTMRDLCIAFRDFIIDGAPLLWIGGDGDLWGYGLEDMQKIRKAAQDLGVLK
jgi:hypothetical protein